MNKSLLVIGCLLLAFLVPAEAQKKKETIPDLETDAGMVQRMIDNFHCCARPVDKEYSKDVAKLFLRYMDPLRIMFTQPDVKQLTDTQAILQELRGKSHAYTENAAALYRQALTKTDALISQAVQEPFDFTVNEDFYFEEDSSDFAANEKEQRERIYKLIKFHTLNRIMEDELADSTRSKVPIAQRETKEREIVTKILHRRVTNRLNVVWGFDNQIKSMLNEAIVDANDPHSGFQGSVNVKKKRERVYGSAYSFGLKLKENYKGDVVVSGLVPGSAAWKTGEINKEDVLVSLQWEEETPTVLEGEDMDDVEKLFGEKKLRKIKLTVRKSDGQLKTVVLVKGLFYYADSNHVLGYKLDGPTKIAYVVLPSFYGDWEGYYGSSCARDVNKVLEKLQFEVDGLILDMRYNGGGSLEEANQMAGIFIDEGTLGFMKQRGGFSTEMKDPYLGTLYQEPMVVLVNNESASATEYVAAALQDYNRAVIVGTHTFGKATAQRELPADTSIDRGTMLRGEFDTKVRDEVKLTVGKLYRTTGKSIQQQGVQPDIFLPTVFDSVEFREQMMPHVLVHDTIHRKGVFDKFAPLPIQELRDKSAARVKASPRFKMIQKGQQLFADKHKTEEKPLPLQYDKYLALSKKYLQSGRSLLKQIQADSTALFKVIDYHREQPDPRDKPDPVETEMTARLLSRIAHDVYVEEAYSIVSDLVKLRKEGK